MMFISRVQSDHPPAEDAWGLRVSDLGPISAADVEVRQLTLFVGENNSGKSWLASAIWGLFSGFVEGFEQENNPAWKAALAEAKRLLSQKHLSPRTKRALEVRQWLDEKTPTAPSHLVRLRPEWAEWSRKLSKPAMTQLLSRTTPHAGRAASIVLRPRSAALVSWREPLPKSLNRSFFWLATERFQGLSMENSFACGVVEGAQARLPQEIACAILAWFAGWPTFAMGNPDAGYFPASRSSFIHFLPLLARMSFGSQFRSEYGRRVNLRDDIVLSEPQEWFADSLLIRSKTQKTYADLVSVFQKELLHGNVNSDEGSPAHFTFTPESTKLSLPMRSASSVVTELISFVHLLRDRHVPYFLVIEEPEAHLHPKLQRLLARVLVRLTNRGAKLLISTHSDLFAQQINNSLKLGLAKQKLKDADFSALLRRIGADAEEALTPSDVAAFEFRRTGSEQKTTVTRLQVLDDGVVMPSFNEELAAIIREMDDIEAALESAGDA